jgi:ParB family chromosome partitioning protein
MVKRAPARRRPRKAKPGTKGLGPAECQLEQPTGAAADAAEAIAKASGCVVGRTRSRSADIRSCFRFCRSMPSSPSLSKEICPMLITNGPLTSSTKPGVFSTRSSLVAPKGGFWIPNGRHRLEAMRRLGAKSITALVVADREVAWQILALNTEKAHNLKERSLEVIRIYRGLVDEDATRP